MSIEILFEEDGDVTPFPVYDAGKLYNECVKHGLETDWWVPLANTIHMRSGFESSEAHILLTQNVLLSYQNSDGSPTPEPLWRKYGHKLRLTKDSGARFTVGGWGIKHARAIDGTNVIEDGYTIYLVTLVDLRCPSKNMAYTVAESGSYKTRKTGWNVVTQGNDSYDSSTVNGEDPWDWDEILGQLWLATAMSGIAFPTGGTYPSQTPVDIRPENRSAWAVFCDLLHASGNEIYQNLNGTFYISVIGENYLDDLELLLAGNEHLLVETGHPKPEWRVLPNRVQMAFQARNWSSTKTNINSYWSSEDPLLVTDVSGINITQEDAILGDFTIVEDGIGDGRNRGIIEEVTTFGMTARFDGGAGIVPENQADLLAFSKLVLGRWLKSRASQALDRAYAGFLSLVPSEAYPEVIWYIDLYRGPTTKLVSVITDIGVKDLPEMAGGSEKFRIIRGQSFGAQSGSIIQLDNIWPLSGGLDPSNGNSATLVPVYNIFSKSYADNELVNAVYSEGETGGVDVHWETLKTGGGDESEFRAIRGLVKGSFSAEDGYFIIDNVIPLANGLDPVSAEPTAEIVVANVQFEALMDNTPIVAIYSPGVLPTVDWELLVVERHRMIRGRTYIAVEAEDARFQINNIRVLSSGLDPRTDPTDHTERIWVANYNDDEYEAGEDVYAVFLGENVDPDANWEALPKTGSANSYTALASGAISAGSPSAPNSGTGNVYEHTSGSINNLGDKTLKNPFGHSVMGALALTKIDDDNFLIVGFDLFHALWLRDGFGARKYLGTDGGASSPDDIEWKPTVKCGEVI